MPTHLIRTLQNVPTTGQGGVITLGNFDGVHLGHQALLSAVSKEADELGTSSSVVTFEPHPFEFFKKDKNTIPRITRLREKYMAISHCGIQNVIVLPFNQKLAQTSASDFCVLLQAYLKPKKIIIGDDFKFGKARGGDFSLLQAIGQSLGFAVSAMPTLLIDGERVSSTRVRNALLKGELKLAQQLLGRPYSMLGKIRRGDALGRKWGFPTANIYLHRKLTPVKGVFTVYMHGIAETPLPGVANVGTRPTVDGTRTLLEVHLLDFNQNIYDRYVEVEFCEKLREEEKYPTIDLLKEQIAKDVIVARNYFNQQGVL